MNHSYKYAPDTLDRILQAAGLDVQWRRLSDDQRFLMLLVGPE
jgi:hypothetical protein